MKPTKAVLLEEVELLSCLGPGKGWFLLRSPNPFEIKANVLIKEWKEFCSQSVPAAINLLGEGFEVRDINDNSYASTVEWIIKQTSYL